MISKKSLSVFLVAPENLFQQIEKIVTQKPNLLQAGNWHTLKNGREAFVEEDILDPNTAHCIAGFIVALTPRAASFEKLRIDVDDYANEILVMSARKPIPKAIFTSDEESMLKIIKMRAADERVEQAKFNKRCTAN